MTGAEHSSRQRGALAAPILWVVAVVALALALALFVIGLAGIALLIDGVLSWVHPIDVASAWARTLAGVGLIGGSAGLAALGWAGLERMARPPGAVAHLPFRFLNPSSASDGETATHRTRKFVAAIGILLALVCLPFAVGIHAAAHGPWLG